MTINGLQNSKKYQFVRTSWARGYISRRTAGTVTEYVGKYGTGYKVERPAWASTRFHLVDYYIVK